MTWGRVGVMALLGLSLAGCSGETRFGSPSNESTGTAFGAYMAASADAQPARSSPRPSGPVSSATFNKLLGGRFGAALDDDDRTRAYEAQMQALDNGSAGAPVGWRNEDSGRYGTVVPGPTYQRNAMSCRQFTHTVFIDAKPQVARGTACRGQDGNWTAVS
jgi:surface antigen